MKFTSIETMSPEDVEGKILILKTGNRFNVNAEYVTQEMMKTFPNLTASQILIMPNDFSLISLPRGEVVAWLKRMLKQMTGGL